MKTTIGEWETPEERLEHAPRAAPPRAPASAASAAEQRASRSRPRTTPRPRRDAGAPRRRGRATTTRPTRDKRSSSSSTAASAAASSEEDLRWALREGAVLPEEAIHDVRVLHRFSFVEVDPDQAERAVEFLDGTKLKGKEIRLEIAKS